jgi:hypothetical protein
MGNVLKLLDKFNSVVDLALDKRMLGRFHVQLV